MTGFDPKKLKFGVRRAEPSVFRDYLEQVANQGLLAEKRNLQYGGKRGESVYTHVLNGIMLLDALQHPLGLSDLETRLVFTVFTVHDINKMGEYAGKSYTQIAIPENFERQIERLGLEKFFPECRHYLSEISELARRHGGHSGGLSLMAAPSATIGRDRLEKLLYLVRAADIADLSHTLEEQAHKNSFLSYLNAFADEAQYTFYLHRLAENRGSLSNIMHNAIVDVLQGEGLIPLLYYPDGVAYLAQKGQTPVINASLRRLMARRITASLNEMTGHEFESFIQSGIQGIKVDPKCLELGIPFAKIWTTIHTRVQTRSLDRDDLLAKIINRTQSNYEKNRATAPDSAAYVQTRLDHPHSLLPTAIDRLRDGELIRSYYIFLQTHFKHIYPDPWAHIYGLLDVPAETAPFLSYFDPRWDRPYVLMSELTLGHAAIYERIEADGTQLLEQFETPDDKVELLTDYLARYALFGSAGKIAPPANPAFADHLQEYVGNQHKQCVHCSTLFPTDRWMTNDVRSDITVQTFSNRLRGGPGEPKKYICRICQLQFLVEKLNYETVRDEKTMYLHFFPYSFLPAPFLAGVRDGIAAVRDTDKPVRTLWCRTDEAILADEAGINPDFAIETNAGKAHSYGIYLPKSRNTIGNRLIFPINPAGDNDSQRFLFALWMALVLQQHFGLRVLLSESPIAPFTPEVDLYIDNVALACQGLVQRNDYVQFADHQTATPGTLPALWQQARALFTIQRQVRTLSKKDEMLDLVQAMASGPLHLYYTAEKLLEARVRDAGQASSPEWLEIRLAQHILSSLETLALSKGGDWMTLLSQQLQKLAEIAWQGGLRGKSLKKNSLMTPLDEIFKKLNQQSPAIDDAALQAIIAQDIFEYLERIADEGYSPGRRKMTAATEFVRLFFEEVYAGIYHNNRTRLLADEKLLRSAYLFYIRQQIGSKEEA